MRGPFLIDICGYLVEQGQHISRAIKHHYSINPSNSETNLIIVSADFSDVFTHQQESRSAYCTTVALISVQESLLHNCCSNFSVNFATIHKPDQAISDPVKYIALQKSQAGLFIS